MLLIILRGMNGLQIEKIGYAMGIIFVLLVGSRVAFNKSNRSNRRFSITKAIVKGIVGFFVGIFKATNEFLKDKGFGKIESFFISLMVVLSVLLIII